MASDYPELDAIIKEFPDLLYLNNGRCARCNGAAGEGNRHISRHHIFPNRHWPDNKYVVSLCMANGKPVCDPVRGVNNGGCHPQIEKWIKKVEAGKCKLPVVYCLLTIAFLRGETFFDLLMPEPE